jgi:DNA modification methylase
LRHLPHAAIFKLFRKHSLTNVYDFEHDVTLAEGVDEVGKLPPTFMLLQPQSWHPDVWTDIARMRTMNMHQAQQGREMHLCPLQFDLVNRLVAQMTNPDDLVLDPFSGLATVPYCALKLGRRGLGIELNARYHADGIAYCAAAERDASMPTLFDLTERKE